MSTPLPVKVVPSAAREIAQCGQWWRENRPSARDAPEEELRRAFVLIAEHPGLGARASDPDLEGARRIHLERIDYHLYYRVTPDGGCVQVLALWHARRGSRPRLSGRGEEAGEDASA